MSSNNDDLVGITSFNSAETVSSCHLWRRKIVDSSSASAFRTSGSLSAACSAVRRRATHLIRQLGLRIEGKQPTSRKISVAPEEFAAFHELVRLVGNATFFDVICRLAVIDAGIVQQLGIILEFNDLPLDIAASIIRLFGNLCESKEGAASVLQTKPCVRLIVQWLSKTINNEEECASTTSSPTAAPSRTGKKDTTIVPAADALGKIHEQCIRALRNAASCGTNFAQYLARSEAVYAVAGCVRLFDPNDAGTNGRFPKNAFNSALHFLQTIVQMKDRNIAQQIVRADISEKLMDLVRSSSGSLEVAVGNVIIGMITNYSPLRTDLSKYGAIEWTKEKVEKMLDDKNDWAKVFAGDAPNNKEYLIALIRFCRSSPTRSKLRQNGALDFLLQVFVSGQLFQTKLFNELMSAFLCFLYDDQGLKYLVEYDGFLLNVVHIIDRFSTLFTCTSHHSSNDRDQLKRKGSEDALVREFRADSPTYKRFHVDRDAVAPASEIEPFEGPLCKDFTNAAFSPGGWNSPNRLSPSSPGPSWSPSASSMLSSVGSTSPNPDSTDNGSCWSPASDSHHDIDFEYEWSQRYECSSRDQTAQTICDCDLKVYESAEYKDQEHALRDSIKLLSWLSHGVHGSLLVNGHYLDILLSYIGNVCRPEPRVGRLVERLARNRLFTESLLDLEFHRRVTDTLCMAKCGNGKTTWCVRCRKLCKIGCGIVDSFRAQVDTEFGFGTLDHMMAVGHEGARVKCLCAMLYLVKSSWRVKYRMIDQGGLQILINALSSIQQDNDTVFNVVKALYAAVQKDSACFRFPDTSSLEAIATSCNFVPSDQISDENRVTFLEKDGDRSIDCNKEVLAASSPFYRALFSGLYSESSQRRFIFDEKDSINNFTSFVYYIHFLHECRDCDRATLDSASDCLSLLELADKRLCPDLSTLLEMAERHFSDESSSDEEEAALAQALRGDRLDGQANGDEHDRERAAGMNDVERDMILEIIFNRLAGGEAGAADAAVEELVVFHAADWPEERRDDWPEHHRINRPEMAIGLERRGEGNDERRVLFHRMRRLFPYLMGERFRLDGPGRRRRRFGGRPRERDGNENVTGNVLEHQCRYCAGKNQRLQAAPELKFRPTTLRQQILLQLGYSTYGKSGPQSADRLPLPDPLIAEVKRVHEEMEGWLCERKCMDDTSLLLSMYRCFMSNLHWVPGTTVVDRRNTARMIIQCGISPYRMNEFLMAAENCLEEEVRRLWSSVDPRTRERWASTENPHALNPLVAYWISVCANQPEKTLSALRNITDYCLGRGKQCFDSFIYFWPLIVEEKGGLHSESMKQHFDHSFHRAIEYNNPDAAFFIWRQAPIDNYRSMISAAHCCGARNAYYAFEKAVENGLYEVVQFIWNRTDAEQHNGMLLADHGKAFCTAAEKGYVNMAELLWRDTTYNQRFVLLFEQSCAAFRRSCANGHAEIVSLLWKDASAEQRRQILAICNYDAISLACRNGHLNVVEYLFENMGDDVIQHLADTHTDSSMLSKCICEATSIIDPANPPPGSPTADAVLHVLRYLFSKFAVVRGLSSNRSRLVSALVLNECAALTALMEWAERNNKEEEIAFLFNLIEPREREEIDAARFKFGISPGFSRAQAQISTACIPKSSVAPFEG